MTRILSLSLLLSACQSRPVVQPSLEDVILTDKDWEWFYDNFYDKALTEKLNKP